VGISDDPSRMRGHVALAVGALFGLRLSDLSDLKEAKVRLGNIAKAGALYADARRNSACARLAGQAIDGLIQYGADYRVPSGIPTATLQDSTVIQAVQAYSWGHFRGLAQRDIDGLVRRQREAYESAAACCALTHWAAESITKDYGIPVDKVHAVGVGANYEFGEGEAQERNWLKPRFLFVGKDWERKNGPAVVAAFEKVREKFPDARLDLVGGHLRIAQEGVIGHGLLAMAEPTDRAKLTALFNEATAFVMPSLHEPAGSVYIEAGAAGIPSIGTNNGGAATCIGDGGYVVDPASPGELIDAMLRLCNPATAKRLGALAREHAKQFTWRKVAERLVRALGIPGLDLTGFAEFL